MTPWWKINESDLIRQVAEYDTLGFFQSARSLAFVGNLFIAALTAGLIYFGILDEWSYIDVAAFIIMGVFVWRGHRWAMWLNVAFWTGGKIFGIVDAFVAGPTPNPVHIIMQVIWWNIMMGMFYPALRVEQRRRRIMKAARPEKLLDCDDPVAIARQAARKTPTLKRRLIVHGIGWLVCTWVMLALSITDFKHLDIEPFSHVGALVAATIAVEAAVIWLILYGLSRVLRPSYIARHWRGELRLGLSFWANGLFAYLIVGIFAAIILSPDILLHPQLTTALYASSGLLQIMVGAGYLVGVWKSSGYSIRRHRGRSETFVWAFLARAVVAVSFLALIATSTLYTIPSTTENMMLALGVDTVPAHRLQVISEHVIALSDGIDFGTAHDLKIMLDASPKIEVVVLSDNVGGRVADATAIQSIIRERKLFTYTNSMCASACTIAYLGGTKRFLGPNGKLGFHRYHFSGMTPWDQTVYDWRGAQSLIDHGVSKEFATKVFATPSDDIWMPDSPTLIRAHVVTDLTDYVINSTR